MNRSAATRTALTLAILAGASALAAPAGADEVKAKGIRYATAQVTGAAEGQLTFRASGASFDVPLSEVQFIQLSGMNALNRAEKLMQGDEPAKAVKAYQAAERRTRTDWQKYLIRHRMLKAATAAGQIDEAVRLWLELLNAARDGERLLPARPDSLAGASSAANKKAIALLKPAVAKAKSKAVRAAMAQLLLKLYQAEDMDDQARELAREELGAAAAPDGEGPSAAGLAAQLEGLAVLVQSDPAKVESQIRENLDNYSPSELARALLLLGQSQVVQALRADDAESKQRQMMAAGLNFMRVWVYYPTTDEAPEALFLAGKVNASLARPNRAAAETAYRRVLRDYPKSEAAAKARAALKELTG